MTHVLSSYVENYWENMFSPVLPEINISLNNLFPMHPIENFLGLFICFTMLHVCQVLCN